MTPVSFTRKVGSGLLLLLAVLAPTANAQSAEEKFHKAYYLENELGDWSAAAQLYSEVTADKRASAELKTQAQTRNQFCREEIICTDMSRLMPPAALAYIELGSPGDQLTQLLKMLGLLREDGGLVGASAQRFAVSPELIREILGLRGLAVAITGFDPASRQPAGVAVLHPGNLEILRGLIETALPAGGLPETSIEGYPTYNIEGQVLITITQRLIILSPQRAEIEAVVARLKGVETTSLADEPCMAEALRRNSPALLSFCVNFKPIMPLINAGLAAASGQSRELALVQAALDLQSLKMLTGRLGVDQDGLSLDVRLLLEKGHRNLAFYFLKLPAVDQEIFNRIPAGAAFCVAAALNDPQSQYHAARSEDRQPQPTMFLDLGREVFANIVSLALFALPDAAAPRENGSPLPSVAAVVRVHDSEKSLALWSQALGVASLAAGGGALDGMNVEIEQLSARRFVFPGGVSVYLLRADDDVIISPSKDAIRATLETRRDGSSIRKDPAYGSCLRQIGNGTTMALMAHPGRCLRLARPFMSADDWTQAEPFAEAMTDTVAAISVLHSDTEFQFAARVTGLPNVGPLITRMIELEREHDLLRRELRQAGRTGDWKAALKTVQALRQRQPENADLLWREFEIRALRMQDVEATQTLGENLLAAWHDNPMMLNNRAWELLTNEDYGGRFADLALRMSRRSNELTNHRDWRYLDTLAHALYQTGDAPAAVDMEKRALELCKDAPGRRDLEAALERFRLSAAIEM